LIVAALLLISTNILQQNKVGGKCGGCEAVYENDIPFEKLSDIIKLPDVTLHGIKNF
jgi:protocatechuate 3,4-dioxygenase, beta subunit